MKDYIRAPLKSILYISTTYNTMSWFLWLTSLGMKNTYILTLNCLDQSTQQYVQLYMLFVKCVCRYNKLTTVIYAGCSFPLCELLKFTVVAELLSKGWLVGANWALLARTKTCLRECARSTRCCRVATCIIMSSCIESFDKLNTPNIICCTFMLLPSLHDNMYVEVKCKTRRGILAKSRGGLYCKVGGWDGQMAGCEKRGCAGIVKVGKWRMWSTWWRDALVWQVRGTS